jgi:hypothetical protein
LWPPPTIHKEPKKYRADDQPKLDDVEVLRRAQATLNKHLPLEADGYHCTSETLYQVLIGVGVNQGTVESVCAELAEAPDGETIRTYLNEQLRVEDLPRLERQINAALSANWPKKLRRSGPVEVAMDFHDRPYYGKREQAEGLWVRGEAKAGTTRFYRVATAYAIVRGQRLTLALRFVLPPEETVEVLADLWRALRRHALRISCLYLDKGFASVAVFAYLHRREQPALIACPIRGQQGGTRALCQGNKSSRAEHTFKSGSGESFTAQMSVCREPPRESRRQFSLSQAAVADSSCWRSYNSSNSAGGTLPIDSSSRRWLNQSTHSRVAYSTSSSWRQGPRRWITSVLYSPMMVSASALS